MASLENFNSVLVQDPAFVLPGCHVAPGNAFEYRICFRRMKQVNLTTGAERDIRRHA